MKKNNCIVKNSLAKKQEKLDLLFRKAGIQNLLLI